MTRNLLMLTALAEAATGLAIIFAPVALVSLLLGESLDSSGAVTVARVAGVAMISLGLACWLAREEGGTRTGRAVITAMLLYNVAVAALLIHGRLALGLDGIALWPAALAHVALAAWCVAALRPPPG
jgi:hypothetical protein